MPSDSSSDVPSVLPPLLTTALDQSDPADESLQLLVDRLSHRLRGLVNSIEGYTDLLAETLQHSEQREMTFRILEGTAQIEQIVRQLKRYSVPIHPVVRAMAVSTLIDRLRHAMGAVEWKRVVVQRRTDASATVCADPVLVQQALVALLRNALDASSDQPVHLSLSVEADPHCVRFDVWNAGVITAARPIDRVFEPFFSTKRGMLGMGLSMARRIAESHGGTLQLVHSTDEAGTRFAMRLPSRPEGTGSPADIVDDATLC